MNVTSIVAPAATDAAVSPRDAALDVFFDVWYRQQPVSATFTGIHEHDHVLPDYSPEALQASRDAMSLARRSLAEAGHGVLHTDDLRHRDWAAIDGALADAAL